MKSTAIFSSKSSCSLFLFPSSTLRKHNWLLIYLVLFIGILLRLPYLNRSLWYDELWSTSIKLKDPLTLGVTILLDPHPPFYAIFMYAWTSFFGDSEISARIPPLIFGISSIFLTYALALKFFNKYTATLAAILLCLSPVHIWYSREARPYSATLFFVLGLIYSYYRLSHPLRKPQIWFFLYSISILFAIFSHYYITVFLLLISVIALYQPSAFAKRLIAVNILVLSLFSVFIGLKMTVGRFLTGSGYLRVFTIQELFSLFFSWFLMGNSLWNNLVGDGSDSAMILNRLLIHCLQIIFFIIFIKGIGSIVKSHEDPPQIHILLYLFSLPCFLFMLNLGGFQQSYIERSVFVVLPFFYLILANGLTYFRGRLLVVIISFTLVFEVVTLAAFFYKSDQWTVYKPNPDWRTAASYFKHELQTIIKPAFLFATTKSTELTYYDSRFKEFRDEEVNDFSMRKIDKLERLLGEESHLSKLLSSQIRKYTALIMEETKNAKIIIYYERKKEDLEKLLHVYNNEVFYVVHNRYWSEGFDSLMKTITNDFRFNLIDRQSFQGLEIFKFNASGAAPQ
jgi:Dolichyl-phosphate-mannose-protein mannosyltransferase